jgi:cellulose synthase/poly-beta-1,6-N-acetylglucosamine synthase-like glycosyltransferase
MRLARFGYRSGVIDSTTYEEAPTRIGAWLGQRTRWFKGWMRPVKKLFSNLISEAWTFSNS